MAKFRMTSAVKTTIARAVLGAAVLGSGLGLPAAAAHADPVKPVAAQAHQSDETNKISATANQVLNVARSQIGITENSAGGGTPYQQWYAASQRAGETVARDGGNRSAYLNAPWCAMFVSWVGEQTGARPQIGWDAYTVAHAKWFAANKRFGTVAKPGAVVFFAWSGSKDISDINHVGFVVKDNQNGTISTIEGNTGNGKVEERVRPKSQVVGYGYPEYAA
jgi:hypothetical protein